MGSTSKNMTLVVGSSGFLGSALRKLEPPGWNFLDRDLWDLLSASSPKLDGFSRVVYCADYYPGLEETSRSPEIVRSVNMIMFCSLLSAIRRDGVKHLISIGTTACYPTIDSPLAESMFMKEPLNSKMRSYAASRRDLLEMAREVPGLKHNHFVLPNLYGPGDKFSKGRSHLLSSWVRDFSEEDCDLILWDSGARREFMYIYDAAKYLIHLANQSISEEILNVGHGLAPTYSDLADKVLHSLQVNRKIHWDGSRHGIRQREIMNCSELQKYGPFPETTTLDEGIDSSVNFFMSVVRNVRTL